MKLHVDLKENGYDILMEHGILYRLNDYIDLNRKVMIVTDSGVPEAYANIVREQCKKGYVHVIEQGELSRREPPRSSSPRNRIWRPKAMSWIVLRMSWN